MQKLIKTLRKPETEWNQSEDSSMKNVTITLVSSAERMSASLSEAYRNTRMTVLSTSTLSTALRFSLEKKDGERCPKRKGSIQLSSFTDEMLDCLCRKFSGLYKKFTGTDK